MRDEERTMDTISPMTMSEWHIPRPSLSGSAAGSAVGSAVGSAGGSAGGDTRDRGGSASSQGSASNHSTHSVSSGSLLLSAAQLARVHGRHAEEPGSTYRANLNTYAGPHRKLERTDAVLAIPEEADPFWSGVKRGSAGAPESVASSTHFTVVNGFTRHRAGKDTTPCCCNSSHQITVLVISMTILLSACILAAICFVEMRLRKETGYRYS